MIEDYMKIKDILGGGVGQITEDMVEIGKGWECSEEGKRGEGGREEGKRRTEKIFRLPFTLW
jgi:hypothetical protein